MEYVYAALMLHKLKKDVTEENVASVVKASGAEVNEAQVKALVASLADVDIEEAIKAAPVAVAAAPATAAADAPAGDGEKKEKEEGTQGNPAGASSKDAELNERFSEVSTDRLQGIINTYENVKLLDEHAQRRESQRIFIDNLIISNRLKAAVIPIEEIGLWNGKQLKATQMARFRRLRSDWASKGPAGKAELASILREAGLTDESVIEDMVNSVPRTAAAIEAAPQWPQTEN